MENKLTKKDLQKKKKLEKMTTTNKNTDKIWKKNLIKK